MAILPHPTNPHSRDSGNYFLFQFPGNYFFHFRFQLKQQHYIVCDVLQHWVGLDRVGGYWAIWAKHRLVHGWVGGRVHGCFLYGWVIGIDGGWWVHG